MNSFIFLGFWARFFQYPELFIWQLLSGILIGILAPLIGSVIIIKRLSFIADTLSHFSFAGICFGVLLGSVIANSWFEGVFTPVVMGIIFSIAGTFLIEKLRGFYKNYKELSMPIVMSFGAALTGIFIAFSSGSSASTNVLLFGSLSTIGVEDFLVILLMYVIIMIFIIFYYRKIISLCFDETFSKVAGINTKLLQLMITIILAIFVSIVMKIIGVLLISALLIVPVAAAILIGKSFKQTSFIAILFSEISIITGWYISYILEVPSGSVTVLINIFILFAIMFIRYLITEITKNKKNKQENLEIVVEDEKAVTIEKIEKQDS